MPESPSDPTTEFASRLQRFEQDGDPEQLVQLFADDARLWALDGHRVREGREGARTFWQEYRSAFTRIRSEFTREIRGDGASVLEWTAEGALPATGDEDGERPVTYPGVTILVFGADGLISEFRTVYDSGPWVAPVAGVTAPG